MQSWGETGTTCILDQPSIKCSYLQHRRSLYRLRTGTIVYVTLGECAPGFQHKAHRTIPVVPCMAAEI